MNTFEKIIIYDFDGTLTPFSLPKFEILEKSGMKGGIENARFMSMVYEKVKLKNIDLYSALYETFLK